MYHWPSLLNHLWWGEFLNGSFPYNPFSENQNQWTSYQIFFRALKKIELSYSRKEIPITIDKGIWVYTGNEWF